MSKQKVELEYDVESALLPTEADRAYTVFKGRGIKLRELRYFSPIDIGARCMVSPVEVAKAANRKPQVKEVVVA